MRKLQVDEKKNKKKQVWVRKLHDIESYTSKYVIILKNLKIK